ncbi:MAG TPA: IS4 family transposase [Blastocatellia bacterium]|nr:IS4 family transposase [Blastocatellia bacterium]
MNVLDNLPVQPGAFIVMDRGYIDFARLFALHLSLAFFVIRAKENLKFKRQSSRPIDWSTGLRSDQTIILTGPRAKDRYSLPLRRVTYYSKDQDKHYVFLTNNFTIEALTIADLYHKRWLIELFFKWIKQHLRIKQFFGTSINSVKTQIWIAICVYLLIAILKQHLGLEDSIYTILQVLSVSLFEKTPVQSLFRRPAQPFSQPCSSKQLDLFDI